jgi:hypothetical protein
MHLYKRLICLVIFIILSLPANAANSQQQNETPIVREFQKHPVGFSLIGIGSVISFFGFTGLFAGGINPGYYCNEEKNKRAGESNEDCRERISDQNTKFYRTMAGVFGTGLLVAGTGGGLILWKNSRSDESDTVSFSISDKSPTIIFTADIP